MKIGILGSGSVGQQIGLGFLKGGHSVKIGTRDASKLKDWLVQAGANASVGTFEETAAFGEMLVLATKWDDRATEKVIHAAGEHSFNGKVVIDITNPLLFTEYGLPPVPALSYPKSGGAAVQDLIPGAKVVKAFNSVTAHYMCNPKLEEGLIDLFICGNDAAAKKTVMDFAKGWGWQNVHDMGDIQQSWLLEAFAFLWIRYGFLNNHWTHGFKLLQK